MKKSIFNLSLITFVAGTILTSCTSSAEKVDTAKENVEAAALDLDQAKADYNAEYEKFKLESEEKITANEKIIADLKEYSKSIKKEMKADYEKAITSLEQKNEVMKAKVKNYKNDGNEKWQSFKREFNHDMDELGQALKDLTKNNAK